MLLPHELLAEMYSAYPQEFQKFIVGDAPLREFWSHIPADDPWLQGHPILRDPDYANHAIPLRLHGDGVPVGKAKRRSLDVVSLSSLTGCPGKSWGTKLLLSGGVDGAKCEAEGEGGGPSTMSVIWQVLLWSFAALCRGRWPVADWTGALWPESSWRARKAGQRICGEHSFAVMCVSADLDYLCNYFGLSHFNSADQPCFRCTANRTTKPWSDLRPAAAWRSELLTPAQWLLTPKHQLFASPRVGISVWHVCIDVLHTLELGVCQHVGASCLYMLAFDAGLDGPLANRLAALWRMVGECYDALGTPAGERLAHALFLAIWEKSKSAHPTHYPQLHSKAAVARHSVPMLKLLLRRAAPATEAFGHATAVVEGLSLFYDVIRDNGMWLEADARQEAHDGLLHAGVHHQALCHLNMASGRKLWYMTEKTHYAQHIALDLMRTGFNPRFGWTYVDEDYVGRIAQVARACLRGARAFEGWIRLVVQVEVLHVLALATPLSGLTCGLKIKHGA